MVLRATVNSAASPSSASASAMTMAGGSSSSAMVPVAAPVLDGRAVGVAEVEGEGLVLLVGFVFEGGHRNRLGVLAGGERQGARSGGVVGAFLG